MKRVLILLLFVLTACAGPMGPPGPVGPQGPAGPPGQASAAVVEEIECTIYVDEEVENPGAFIKRCWLLDEWFSFHVWVEDKNKINEASESEAFYIVPEIQPSGFAVDATGAGYVRGRDPAVMGSTRWAEVPGQSLRGAQVIFSELGELKIIGKRQPWTWTNTTEMFGSILFPPPIP